MLRPSVGLSHVRHQGKPTKILPIIVSYQYLLLPVHSNHMEHLERLTLLLHLLERGDVGVLGDCQQKESGLHSYEFRIVLQSNKTNSLFR